MPNGTVIIHHYKKYMENHDLADNDRQMLFCFFHEIVGCVNLTWKENHQREEHTFKTCHNIR